MKNKFLITFTFIVTLFLFSSIGFSKSESNSFLNITIPQECLDVHSFMPRTWCEFKIGNLGNSTIKLTIEMVNSQVPFTSDIEVEDTRCGSCYIGNSSYVENCTACGNENYWKKFTKTTLIADKKYKHNETQENPNTEKNFRATMTFPQEFGFSEWNITAIDEYTNNSLEFHPNMTYENATILEDDFADGVINGTIWYNATPSGGTYSESGGDYILTHSASVVTNLNSILRYDLMTSPKQNYTVDYSFADFDSGTPTNYTLWIFNESISWEFNYDGIYNNKNAELLFTLSSLPAIATNNNISLIINLTNNDNNWEITVLLNGTVWKTHTTTLKKFNSSQELYLGWQLWVDNTDSGESFIKIGQFNLSATSQSNITNNAPLILNISRMPNTAVYGGSYNFTAIFFDADNTNLSYANFSFKFANNTIKEVNMSRMYPINSSATNWTMPYLINLNTQNTSLGIHKYWINASDGTATVNSAITEMNITDFVKPDLTIINPLNQSYGNNTAITLNYSAVDNVELSKIWYELNNNGTNITTTTNLSFNLPARDYFLELWTNDSSNNINYSNISFRAIFDEIKPDLNITNPLNQSYANTNSLPFNYTVNDTNLDIVWYQFNRNGTNITASDNTTTMNFTISNLRYGSYITEFWANDSSNNINYSNVSFFLSTQNNFTDINSNSTNMTVGFYNDFYLTSNITSGFGTDISAVYYEVTFPNGTKKTLNSTKSNDLWNSTNIKASANGTWQILVNSSNNIGYFNTSRFNIEIADTVVISPFPEYSFIVQNEADRASNITINFSVFTDTTSDLAYNLTISMYNKTAHTTNISNNSFSLSKNNFNSSSPKYVNLYINNTLTLGAPDGEYEGNFTLTRIIDNLKWVGRIKKSINPPMGKITIYDTLNVKCNELSSSTCAYTDTILSTDTKSKSWIVNNTGNFTLSGCYANLTQDFSGKTFYSFDFNPFSLNIGNTKTITALFSQPPAGTYFGRVNIKCNASNLGFTSSLDPENSPYISLTVNSANVPAGGGAGGAGPSLNITNLTAQIKELFGLVNATFKISPSIIDVYHFYKPFSRDDEIWEYTLKSNKQLKECSITEGWNCTILNNTVKVSTMLNDPLKFSFVKSSKLKVISIIDESLEIPISIRVINLAYSFEFQAMKTDNPILSNNLFFKYKEGLLLGVRLWWIFTSMGMFGAGLFIFRRR